MNKEKGVWIVYDLDANRMIQELLIRNEFKFRFDPSLEIINREARREFEKMIEEVYDDLPNYNEDVEYIISTIFNNIKRKLEEKK